MPAPGRTQRRGQSLKWQDARGLRGKTQHQVTFWRVTGDFSLVRALSALRAACRIQNGEQRAGPTPFSSGIARRGSSRVACLSQTLSAAAKEAWQSRGETHTRSDLYRSCTWRLYKRITSSNTALRFLLHKFPEHAKMPAWLVLQQPRPEPPSFGHAATPRGGRRTQQPPGPHRRTSKRQRTPPQDKGSLEPVAARSSSKLPQEFFSTERTPAQSLQRVPIQSVGPRVLWTSLFYTVSRCSRMGPTLPSPRTYTAPTRNGR